MQEITIGLLGIGTVGTGVVRVLQNNRDRIEARLGAGLRLKRIACRDPDKPRDLAVDRSLLTGRPGEVVDDPDVDVVVELFGGGEPTLALLRRAIANGKHVVTANKALVADHGDELMALADEHGVDILYEASVGGGIPVIRSIREALASDRIHALYGIINGTTNYILTRMSEDQRPFDSVLEEAVRDGYAEADPSFDVDGIDAAQKLAILSTLAFGTRVTPADIYTEGIRQVTPFDVAAAAEMRHVIKLLAIAQKSDEGLDVRVHPALVPDTNLLSHVTGVYNAVLVDCHAIGVQLYYGRGAGMMPTAGAVVSDVIEVGRAIMQGRHGRLPGFGHHLLGRPDLKHIPIEETYSRYYLCYEVVDRPGVLGQIASILGDLHVSIAEMKQSASETPRGVPITMLTHDAREGAVVEAIKLIDQLEVTVAPTRKLRVAPEVPQ